MKDEEWLDGHSSFIVMGSQSKSVFSRIMTGSHKALADCQKNMKGLAAVKSSIKDTVRKLVEPTVNGLGYRIWDVTYSKVGADYHLEITIDNDDGINIDDCERVHRAVDPILDEFDPIENFYYLEVSSPGIERELRTEEHINLSIGKRVEARFFADKDGRRNAIGVLTAFDGESVTVLEEGTERNIKRSEIAKLTTVYFE